MKKYVSFLLTLGFLTVTHSIIAQGTAFTYQGRLQNNGNPANGNYDFSFALFNDANTNSGQIGTTLTNLDVAVTNGLFTVALDFGPVFAGNATWLAIGVRTNGVGGFTPLSPLQELTPAPYAIYASNAATALNAKSVAATNISGTIALTQLAPGVITNDSADLVLGGAITNVIAPLTVPPNLPSAAIGSVATGSNSQCVVVAGRYAYVANYSSSNLDVVDVSVPTSPVIVGSLNVPGNPSAVTVAGRYAYMEYQNSTTMDVIDISDPASPVIVGSIATGNYPSSIAVSGRYVYEVNSGASTLYVIDVNNPSKPVIVGTVATDTGPNSVVVAGRYAYVGNGSSGFFDVIDVSNPSAPVLVGYTSAGPNITSVAVAGRYAYAANSGTLFVLDVSNPAGPAVVGGATIGNNSTCVVVAGRFAYVTDGGLGKVEVIDVSNPANPIEVGTVSTGGSPNSVAVAGRYVYAANRNGAGTLQVFDFGGEYVQQLEAGAAELGTLQTRDTITAGNNVDVRGGLTVSGSARITGGLSVDTGTITASNIIASNITGNIGISSSLWFVTNVINSAGPLTLSASFTSQGTTLVIHASGSGYTTTAGSSIGMNVQIDGTTIDTCKIDANAASTHMAFVPKTIVKTGLPAGAHTLKLVALSGTTTDSNDNFNVTIEELPY